MKGMFLALVAAHYSENMLCRRKHCINPIFPAMRVTGQDLMAAQENRTWACAARQQPLADKYLSFCAGAVHYDFALPVDGPATIKQGVKLAEQQALKQYFQHLSGMKLDAFDYRQPRDDPCTEQVWKMACYAYFPKCNALNEAAYLRPCASTCAKYVSACGVECCDESVQCVFAKSVQLADGTAHVEEGFVDQVGPSATCTGAATRIGLAALALLLGDRHAPLALAVLALQGCSSEDANYGYGLLRNKFSMMRDGVESLDTFSQYVPSAPSIPRSGDAAAARFSAVPQHSVGFWRQEPDFSVTDAFVLGAGCQNTLPPNVVDTERNTCMAYNNDPRLCGKHDDAEFVAARFCCACGGGSSPATPDGAGGLRFDSCSVPGLDALTVCSGRGVCEAFDPEDVDDPVAFCRCDDGWAGPECRDKRKSQETAFWLAVFLGPLGADQFYCGYGVAGLVKLLTGGGLGAWWLYDVVRIGLAPVQTNRSYKLRGDFPFEFFVVVAVFGSLLIGFLLFLRTLHQHVKTKRANALLPASESEFLGQVLARTRVSGKPNLHLDKKGPSGTSVHQLLPGYKA